MAIIFFKTHTQQLFRNRIEVLKDFFSCISHTKSKFLLSKRFDSKLSHHEVFVQKPGQQYLEFTIWYGIFSTLNFQLVLSRAEAFDLNVQNTLIQNSLKHQCITYYLPNLSRQEGTQDFQTFQELIFFKKVISCQHTQTKNICCFQNVL